MYPDLVNIGFFHLRTYGACMATGFLLCWTIIVPIAGAVCMCILAVIQIICFVRICKGQAKEAPIVCKFGFLK